MPKFTYNFTHEVFLYEAKYKVLSKPETVDNRLLNEIVKIFYRQTVKYDRQILLEMISLE